MLHPLPLGRKFGPSIVPAPAAPPAQPGMVEVPAGRATLGLPRRLAGRTSSPRTPRLAASAA